MKSIQLILVGAIVLPALSVVAREDPAELYVSLWPSPPRALANRLSTTSLRRDLEYASSVYAREPEPRRNLRRGMEKVIGLLERIQGQKPPPGPFIPPHLRHLNAHQRRRPWRYGLRPRDLGTEEELYARDLYEQLVDELAARELEERDLSAQLDELD